MTTAAAATVLSAKSFAMGSTEVASARPRRKPVDMPIAPERRNTLTTGGSEPVVMRRQRRFAHSNAMGAM